MSDGRARPAAVLTVGITALLTGAFIAVVAHAITTHMKGVCAADRAVNSESMCDLWTIIWGPLMAGGAGLFAGLVLWPVLAIAGIAPRGRILAVAFLLPVLLVEPLGLAGSIPAPVLVTTLVYGLVQAWITFAAGARLTHR